MNLEKFAPDIVNTVKRFPYATILAALSAFVLIGLSNEFIPDGDETAMRLLFGFIAAAIFSLGGVLFAESGRSNIFLNAVLTYILPVLVIGAMQVRTYEWVMPVPLFAVGFLWLSVAAFTHIGTGETREHAQDKFWWMNHRAVATGVLAFAGFSIISLGLIAIERSMSLLFGINSDQIFYGYLLPFTGMFLTPLYWFSTIPKLEEFDPKELTEPDFLSRAIGFLGQFVLVPLLLAYSAILLAYAVQIIFNGKLPEGTIGWMVLGYLVTGAATWLVLHPPFMRDKQIVRLFRKFWFWLTIVPLLLYCTAVFIRVDAYGLTSERVLLVAGGAWAGLLTLAFLWRRLADIRLIPALAGIILLIISVGPWNVQNAAVANQSARLKSAMQAVSWTPENNTPSWDAQNASQAESAFDFLTDQDDNSALSAIFATYGLSSDALAALDASSIDMLNLPEELGDGPTHFTLGVEGTGSQVDVGATTIYLGDFIVYPDNTSEHANLRFSFDGIDMVVSRAETEIKRISLEPWRSLQGSELITEPLLTFAVEDKNFALIIKYATFERKDALNVTHISGLLFSDTRP